MSLPLVIETIVLPLSIFLTFRLLLSGEGRTTLELIEAMGFLGSLKSKTYMH